MSRTIKVTVVFLAATAVYTPLYQNYLASPLLFVVVLVTVAALTVLGRTEELKLHLQAALNVGCSVEDLAETIFQTAVYGGVPAMNAALKTLRDVLRQKGMWKEAP